MGNLLVIAVVLWFSSIESNPWSLDCLIFARREEPIRLVPVERTGSPAPNQAPPAPPGERTKVFLANRGE